MLWCRLGTCNVSQVLIFEQEGRFIRRFAAFAFNKLREEKRQSFEINKPKKKSESPLAKLNIKDLAISCKRPQFNLLKTRVGKCDATSLASGAWANRKSNGDFFTILPTTMQEAKPVPSGSNNMTFEEAGLSAEIAAAVNKLGFSNPTNIQVEGVDPILKGHNVLLAAETGCGKTFAFLLPMIQQIKQWKRYKEEKANTPLALIITPSRELAYQITGVANELGADLDFKPKLLIGGRTKRVMMNPSFEHVDLLVATLGALSKLTTTGVYNLSQIHHVVLDEADTLLDDSFNEKLRHLLSKIPFQYQCHRVLNAAPEGAQLTLASATMPTEIGPILEGIIPEESLVQVTTPGLHRVMPNVSQKFIRIGRIHKPEELLKIAKSATKSKTPTLIFSNKSPTCDWISMFLNESGIKCVNLNGEMPLPIRQGKFLKFQSGEVNILSTTDIGSRGLDTIRAQLVLNYDFPCYMADYIHRCGRTGRIGTSGSIVNFICGSIETKLVQAIETAARTGEPLQRVNNNITKIIEQKIQSRMR